jgi:hypothetical protein
MNEDELRRSIDEAREHLRLNPGDSKKRYELGMFMMQVGDLHDAIREFQIVRKSREYTEPAFQAIHACMIKIGKQLGFRK